MTLFRAVEISVPGKVILMGEHAVVYGCPGLVTTVGARVTLDLGAVDSPGLDIGLADFGASARLALSWSEVFARAKSARADWRARTSSVAGEGTSSGSQSPFEGAASFVAVAVGETLEALGLVDATVGTGLRIEVRSDLPIGSGMGSSAAVAVAVVTGLAASLGRTLDFDEVDQIAFEIESRQHGRPSGIDNAAVLRGGVLWFERDSDDLLIEPLELDEESLSGFHLYHTGQPSSSTGEVVAAVRAQRERDVTAFDRRLEGMSRTCSEMRRALLEGGDPAPMIRAWQRELEAIGVVPRNIVEVVRGVERAGGAAKISGAGALRGPGAGALLVYHRDTSALESLACLSDFDRFRVPLAVEGARVDDLNQRVRPKE